MPELLFEIGTEELPADHVRQNVQGLADLAKVCFKKARLPIDRIEIFATPRRLALRGVVADRQENFEMIRRGPAIEVAFKDGNPAPALLGFARSSGVLVDQLIKEDGYVHAKIFEEGKKASDILPEILANLVLELPANKKMRWGNGDIGFVRPISWLLALLDDQVIPVKIGDLTAHHTTYGHRFMSNHKVLVQINEYEQILENLYVIANREKRRQLVLNKARTIANDLELAFNDDLLEEVTDLVEFPIAIKGKFDEKYLDLPDEVLSTVMIHHQRYFPLKKDRLTNYFVAIANNNGDENIIRQGFETVLAGRLSDAKFFWEADIAKPLIEHKNKLSGMAFQKELGSMLDKAKRTCDLAIKISETLGIDQTKIKSIAPIFKADLATQMVFEFAELAGIMGRIYAEKEGFSGSNLLEEANKPLTNYGELPQTLEGSILSLADRIDTLVGFFAISKTPTGSTDPFGLRRAGIAVVRILVTRGLSLSLEKLIKLSADIYKHKNIKVDNKVLGDLENFLLDRLQNMLEESGLKGTQFRAVSANSKKLLDIVQRSWLLAYLYQSEDFKNLSILYKRVSNITKGINNTNINPSLFELNEEIELYGALPQLKEAVDGLISAWKKSQSNGDMAQQRHDAEKLGEFSDLFNKLLEFKPKLDAFLDKVLVMVEEKSLRNNRVALLTSIREELIKFGQLELL